MTSLILLQYGYNDSTSHIFTDTAPELIPVNSAPVINWKLSIHSRGGLGVRSFLKERLGVY